MTAEDHVMDEALTVIAVFEDAFKNGYNHYTMDGKYLSTTKEVLEALLKDKRI